MKLSALLTGLADEDLDRLAVEHVRTDEKLSRAQLCNFLEGVLRSYEFISSFIINRQPPTFALLTSLLDAPGYRLPVDGFRDRVMQETRRIVAQVESGEILARDEQLRLYRGALYEARRNDFDVNASEAAILAVLRRQTGISQVEHFLIEHHADLREFWEKGDAFVHEENALRSAGLIFLRDAYVLIADEVAPALRQTLGIDMPTDSVRRLLAHLSSGDLMAALEKSGSRTTGSKEIRFERILTERIQPHVVLRSVDLGTLKEICRDAGASATGNKEDLIDRIIDHFAEGKDQIPDEPLPPQRREVRRLSESQFELLFGFLLHQELTDILRRFSDLRQTGTKEIRIRTLWQAELSEQTLLSELMNRDLEGILQRLRVRLGGSKDERIERIINHFCDGGGHAAAEGSAAPETQPASLAEENEAAIPSAAMLANQELFRQKSSSPQPALQPWLEEVLEAPGLVRCYATEDPNPTKQLKNKLSQAAAAQGGLLVLLLADGDAFAKAFEALVERWMTNDEWSKSVACVALAHPLAAPTVHVVVEGTASPWGSRIRARLFGTAKVIRAKGASGSRSTQAVGCTECGASLPIAARFCPHCGARIKN